MSTLVRIKLWGRTIAALHHEKGRDYAYFQYDEDFAQSRIEVAPLRMPLSNAVYSFPGLPQETFHGLPGLLADSLPDKFGHALIDAWLARQGRVAQSFSAAERLCYVGSRGTGALEFEPEEGPEHEPSRSLQVSSLVELASEVLSERHSLHVSFADEAKEQAMRDILYVGTSAGGARAKALISWNPITQEVRSGQLSSGNGFEYWLLKFDGVSSNRDKELEDPKGYGAVEYAYSLMAKEAGIEMSECRLFEEMGRRHFMTKRFDRLDGGQKLHMQSLCALEHFDFNQAGAYGYEQVFETIASLGLGMNTREEQFRRMAFNILARNQDDHVKNIAFLMDKQGRWSLSPAFDLTFSYNPQGTWTAVHQMSMNGKRDGFELDDFKTCAKTVSLKRGRSEEILEEVQSALLQWPRFAAEATLDEDWAQQIQRHYRRVL